MWNILKNIYILIVSAGLIYCFLLLQHNQKEHDLETAKLQREKIHYIQLINDTHYFYKDMIHEKIKKETVEVEITAYTARKEECDDTPWFTAIMEKPIPGGTIAVSRDLKHLLGKRVYMLGYGVRRVNDLMNERYSKRVDILVASVDEAYRHGIKKGKLVIID